MSLACGWLPRTWGKYIVTDGTVVVTGTDSDWMNLQSPVLSWCNIKAIWAEQDATIGLTNTGEIVTAGTAVSASSMSGIVDAAVATTNGSILALKYDGTCVTAGSNMDGALQVSGWSDIVQIAYYSAHSLGLRSDGTVVAAGAKSHDRIEVGNWTNIVEVAAGKAHSVGLKSDGTVVTTGWDRECVNRAKSWSDIVSIRAGGLATIGIKADGTIIAAGQWWNDMDIAAFNERIG